MFCQKNPIKPKQPKNHPNNAPTFQYNGIVRKRENMTNNNEEGQFLMMNV